MTLAKSSAVTWSSLSSNLATSGQSTPSPITRPPPKSDLAAEPRHEAETATPEGSVTAGKKEKKDWSKIAATEEAEEEAVSCGSMAEITAVSKRLSLHLRVARMTSSKSCSRTQTTTPGVP